MIIKAFMMINEAFTPAKITADSHFFHPNPPKTSILIDDGLLARYLKQSLLWK